MRDQTVRKSAKFEVWLLQDKSRLRAHKDLKKHRTCHDQFFLSPTAGGIWGRRGSEYVDEDARRNCATSTEVRMRVKRRTSAKFEICLLHAHDKSKNGQTWT